MQLTCLCATYGRYQSLREALWCFLNQDCDAGRLLIWNFHSTPIHLAERYPRVTLINKPDNGDNVHIWMTGLGMVETPYVRAWMDDDLYTPWAISDALANIGNSGATMPRMRWRLNRKIQRFLLDTDPNDGAGATLKTDVARTLGMSKWPGIILPADIRYTDTPAHWIMTDQDECGLARMRSHMITKEMHSVTLQERDKVWRSRQHDPGDGTPMTPKSVAHFWPRIAAKDLATRAMFERRKPQ